ncbi:hypothetical protein PLANTIT3_61402 [Plantibacter sp. T3]|nr:hypothetical protein PLANTIT3_61402 [Plantibacter sp. T3]
MGSRTGDASSCLIDRGSARRSLRLSRGTRRPQRIQGAYHRDLAQRGNLAPSLSGAHAPAKDSGRVRGDLAQAFRSLSPVEGQQ